MNLGDTPYGSRRVGRFGAGSFEGPKLKGTVLPGGACWMLMRRDDVLEIEVRITLETDDKQQIYMSWKGFLMARRRSLIDSIEARLSTRTPRSIATGSRSASGRTFEVFQVL